MVMIPEMVGQVLIITDIHSKTDGSMRQIVMITFLINGFYNCFSQDLIKVKLLKEDSTNKVSERFESHAPGGYAGSELLLKNDNSYEYKVGTDLSNQFSSGTWKKKGKFLILNSSIQKDGLPIKIAYGSNGTFEKDFRIAVIKNIKGDFIPGFVLVNNDSNKCDPSLGFCNESFDKINRVKVLLENGMSSKWIEVEKPSEKIILTLMTDVSMFKYVPMDDVKFNTRRNSL